MQRRAESAGAAKWSGKQGGHRSLLLCVFLLSRSLSAEDSHRSDRRPTSNIFFWSLRGIMRARFTKLYICLAAVTIQSSEPWGLRWLGGRRATTESARTRSSVDLADSVFALCKLSLHGCADRLQKAAGGGYWESLGGGGVGGRLPARPLEGVPGHQHVPDQGLDRSLPH